jgi:Rad3-related DNA helicase
MKLTDGVYEPRLYQAKALDWVVDNWKNAQRLVIHAPVGSGKSLILRAIQRGYGGMIVTPNNVLVHQYRESYPELNSYIGQNNYRCKNIDLPCHVVQRKYKCKNSFSCPFTISRRNFADGKDTVTNTMMCHTLHKDNPPSTILADEAHTIIGNIRQMTNKTIRFTAKHRDIFRKYKINPMELNSDFVFHDFMQAQLDEVRKQIQLHPESDVLANEEYALETTLKHFLDHPELMVRIPEKDRLTHFSVYVSRNYLSSVIGKKSILTSGTLLKHDLSEMLGDEYEEYTIPSPIPAANRGVILNPSSFKHNKSEMDLEALADRILEVQAKTNLNAICHITYGMAPDMEMYLARKFQGNLFIYTKPEDKARTVNAYMESCTKSREGNLLVGAGIVEGLDLKGDLARVNIITKLLFPNIGDPFIQKRMSLPDGRLFYLGETIKNMLQAIGRTTRGPDDKSVTEILDSNIFKLLTDGRKLGLINKDFDDSLLLSDNDKRKAYHAL